MVTSKKGSILGKSTLLAALLSLLMLVFMVPLASAQTQTSNEADTLARALSNDRFYVSQGVKANSQFMQRNGNIEQQLRDTVNKLRGKEDTRIAVISNDVIPSRFSGNTSSYAAFLYDVLNKPSVLIVGNAQNNSVELVSNKLSAAERTTIINEARNTAVSQSFTAGVVQVADRAVNKIESNATSGTLITVGIIVVVVLIIVGAVAFLLVSTKRSWERKVAQTNQLSSQVSDKVYNLSTDVELLPENIKPRVDADFGMATRNLSDAQAGLRELEKVSPVTLLLKGADYNRKLDMTNGQFQQALQALTRVEQQVRSLPGGY